MERSDLPEGQQSNLGPFFNESAEEINVSIRKLVAGLDTLGIRPYADNAPSWSWVLFCLDAVEKLQREVARVRADVAEDLRSYTLNYPAEVFPPDSDVRDAIAGTAMRHAYNNAARLVEEAGKGFPPAVGALPDQAGTREHPEDRDAR